MNEYIKKINQLENELLVSQEILKSKDIKYKYLYKIMRNVINFDLNEEELKKKIAGDGFNTFNKKEIHYIKNIAMFDSYIISLKKGAILTDTDFDTSFCENRSDYMTMKLNFKKMLNKQFESIYDNIRISEWLFYEKYFKKHKTNEYFYNYEDKQIPIFSKMFDNEVIEIIDINNIQYNLKIIEVKNNGVFTVIEAEHNYTLDFYNLGYYWIVEELYYLGKEKYNIDKTNVLNFIFYLKKMNKHLPSIFWDELIEYEQERVNEKI